tara:strand:- start:48 stop:554 length:507 start_codon:yes stop_codon:yes gene_type:complete
MTYIPSGSDDNLAINFNSVTVLYNTSSDISCSVGTVLPLGSERSLKGTDTYSVSSGVITLPSGYYYLLRAGIGAYGSNLTNDLISYRFYNNGTSSYVGRRGWLAWQENPKTTCGDEYAIALVDASSSAQTIDLRIVTQTGSITLDATSSTYQYYTYAGHSRVEIWKWN